MRGIAMAILYWTLVWAYRDREARAIVPFDKDTRRGAVIFHLTWFIATMIVIVEGW